MINFGNNNYISNEVEGNFPLWTGDRRWAQDFVRDFFFQLERAGVTVPDMMGQLPIVLRGGEVSQGGGLTLNILSGTGYVRTKVRLPGSFTTGVPPHTFEEWLEAIRISWESIANLDGAHPKCSVYNVIHDGVTINYVKCVYKESVVFSRPRSNAEGIFDYELMSDWHIVVDSIPTTIPGIPGNEVELSKFTSDGTTFSFSPTFHSKIEEKVLISSTVILPTNRKKVFLSILTEGINVVLGLGTGNNHLTLEVKNNSSGDAYIGGRKISQGKTVIYTRSSSPYVNNLNLLSPKMDGNLIDKSHLDILPSEDLFSSGTIIIKEYSYFFRINFRGIDPSLSEIAIDGSLQNPVDLTRIHIILSNHNIVNGGVTFTRGPSSIRLEYGYSCIVRLTQDGLELVTSRANHLGKIHPSDKYTSGINNASISGGDIYTILEKYLPYSGAPGIGINGSIRQLGVNAIVVTSIATRSGDTITIQGIIDNTRTLSPISVNSGTTTLYTVSVNF